MGEAGGRLKTLSGDCSPAPATWRRWPTSRGPTSSAGDLPHSKNVANLLVITSKIGSDSENGRPAGRGAAWGRRSRRGGGGWRGGRSSRRARSPCAPPTSSPVGSLNLRFECNTEPEQSAQWCQEESAMTREKSFRASGVRCWTPLSDDPLDTTSNQK